MLQQIKAELRDPQPARRTMKVEIKNHFVRNSTKKSIHLEDMVQAFGVNWDNRVVDRSKSKTYPYGYVRIAN